MPALIRCHVPRCRETPKGGADSPQQDLCTGHWFMVPAPLRKTLTFLWNNGHPRSGYDEARASAMLQVLARINGDG